MKTSQKLRLYFEFYFYGICRWYFRKSTRFEVEDWSKKILLQMIFGLKYIREFCCYCQKTMSYSRSSKSGDSGGVCPKCFREECLAAYNYMKEQGNLTPEQIAEAEGPGTLTDEQIIEAERQKALVEQQLAESGKVVP